MKGPKIFSLLIWSVSTNCFTFVVEQNAKTMHTQKVTGALRKHGFQSFFTQKEWHGNTKIPVRYGDYKVSVIGKSKQTSVETTGANTEDLLNALHAEGIKAEEVVEGCALLKILG